MPYTSALILRNYPSVLEHSTTLKFVTSADQIVPFHFAILNGPDLPLG